jgi:hypothetical protein
MPRRGLALKQLFESTLGGRQGLLGLLWDRADQQDASALATRLTSWVQRAIPRNRLVKSSSANFSSSGWLGSSSLW